MTIQEINKKNIWEIIRPIKELQENTNKLYKSCREDLEKVREIISETSSQIQFNKDEHRYFYGNEECMPVSHIVDLFVPETDFDLVAKNYVEKNNILEPWQKVRQKWLLKGTYSTTNGTFIHQYGEDLNNICNNFPKKDLSLVEYCLVDGYYIPIHPKQVAIYKYFEYCLLNKEIPFLSEIKLIWKEFGITGTLDQLVYSIKDKGFILRDYKTNQILKKDFQKPMKSPFQMYNDEALSHYILQQNLYEIMLNLIDIKIIRKELVWLKDNETFELIILPDIKDLVKEAIKSL